MAHHGGTLVFPSLVRTQVLEQHAEIRALLERLLTGVGGAGNEMAEALRLERLRSAARDLCGRFRSHLAFEDEELTRVFAVLDAWGPERVSDLQRHHARQRRDLDSLLEGFETTVDVECLAGAVRALAEDLLRDMEAEEEGCLRASLLGADSLTIERR